MDNGWYMSALVTSTSNPWLQILSALEKKVNRHSYDTWFKPTRFSHDANGKLFVTVPSQEFCAIGERYNDLILEAIENLGMEYRDVEFVPAPPEPEPAPTSNATPPTASTSATNWRHDGRSPSSGQANKEAQIGRV